MVQCRHIGCDLNNAVKNTELSKHIKKDQQTTETIKQY